jgi:hypothetical protein
LQPTFNVPYNWAINSTVIPENDFRPRYKALNQLTAAGTRDQEQTYFVLNNNSYAVFEAGSQIVLKDGFKAVNGSIFRASIREFNNYCDGISDITGYLNNNLNNVSSPKKSDAEENIDKSLLPDKTDIQNNYPNPFTGKTNIKYALKADGNVKLNIYNVLGQKVRSLVNGQTTAGYHAITWDGTNDNGQHISRGVYLCRFNAGEYTKSFKMVLVK